MSVDEPGFERSLEGQREQSRQGAKFAAHDTVRVGQFYSELRDKEGLRSTFTGYERPRDDATILALLIGTAAVREAGKGTECEVVLDRTPFYPEGGGQVGDVGEFVSPNGRALVSDTQEPSTGVIVHSATVIEGTLRVGDAIEARVDEQKRHDTMRNHTATHMLHATVRRVLGDHVYQAGSLVEPARLRFDFTYDRPVTPAQIARIEDDINATILDDRPVQAHVMPLEEALASGALALFDEKYADTVRVMEVAGVSRELCGGTHVRATGEIGLFVVTKEESVGTGVRRLEALTGRSARRYLAEQRDTLGALGAQLRVPRNRIVETVGALQETHRRLEKQLAGLERESVEAQIDGILDRSAQVNGTRVVAAQVSARDVAQLRAIGDRLRDRLGSGVILLGTVAGERAQMIAVVTKDLVSRGIDAKQLIDLAAPLIAGGGGGRPESASAGGRDPARLNEALEAAARAVRERLSRSGG